MTSSPFDDIKALIAGLPQVAPSSLTADPALGRLGVIAAQLSRWSAPGKPRVLRPIVALYAGSHADGEADALRERLELIAAGGAPINALAQAAGAGLEAFDLAVEQPVGDIALRAAMSERECAATMAFGMEALAKQPDLLVLGDIVTGAPISAAAIALALSAASRAIGCSRTRNARAPPCPGCAPKPARRPNRWKSSANSAAARSPPWPARSWPRAARACRC